MKRLFVAVKIEPAEKFINVYYSLKRELNNEKIKWVEPANMHITLKFLGQTADEHIPLINKTLNDIVGNYHPFGFTLENIGVFGSRYNPRVLWTGINNGGQLRNLGEDILNRLDAAGFERDRQNFVPHLTIGRIKFLESKKHFQKVIDKYKNIFLQEAKVEKFILFQSILKPAGPVYYSLNEFILGT